MGEMRRVPINDEEIILGGKPLQIAWLCRPMNRGEVGTDEHEIFHNLVIHFPVDGDPAFMDRLRMAWQSSGLNTKYALERYPPEADSGDDAISIPVFTAVLENIDAWTAEALKRQFIRELKKTYPEDMEFDKVEEMRADAKGIKGRVDEADDEDRDDEDDDDDDKEEEPEYDPHGMGLQEIPKEKGV